MATLQRYRVDIAGLPGGPGLSTFHFENSGSGATAQQTADAVETFFQAIDTFINVGLTFTGSDELELIDSANGQQTGSTPVVGWGVSGLDSATMLPPITQMLVRWNTTLYTGGRRLQGKTFLPGFCEDSNETAGTPQNAVYTAVQTAADTLAGVFPGLVVFSRKNFNYAPVEAVSVWNKWAILAGRRDG